MARYTHRVAISNHRLVDVSDDTVAFRWKDYRHGSRVRTLTLEATNFSASCNHVLPKRFAARQLLLDAMLADIIDDTS
jgi:hypothetical protein